jgi:hypothetical protein
MKLPARTSRTLIGFGAVVALFGIVLVVLPARDRRDLTLDPVRPPSVPGELIPEDGRRFVPCPAGGVTIDIAGSTDPVVQRRQRDSVIQHVGMDGATIRLGPNVDMDFSDLPADALPIQFGRCVTLTSVANFTDDMPAAARSPRSLGPILRYGLDRRPDSSEAFFEIRCFPAEKMNDGARISGFRLYGPSFDQQSEINNGINVIRCVDVVIANMEIAGWGGDGINIQDDPGQDHGWALNVPGGRISHSEQIQVRNSFFHHNQHPTNEGSAEGYGVNVGHGAWALIVQNVFDFNRHGIATPGDVGGYRAERNLVLKGGGYHGGTGNTYTHSFDVHGVSNCPSWCWPGDCNHLFNCGAAGIQFSYLENAFQYTKDNNIKLRGKPAFQAYIDRNVFPQGQGDAIALRTSENVSIGSGNIEGFDSFGKYGICDFDGDAIDDLFLPTGATWWFSSSGMFHWSYLNRQTARLANVRLGYIDGDLRCDVLVQHGRQWQVYSGGAGNPETLGSFGVPLEDVVLGRFDPSQRDHRPGATRRTTHAFRRDTDGQWYVTPLSGVNWVPVQSSGMPMSQLRFGDFTGDGVTDVLAVVNGRWSISESAASSWRVLNPTLGEPIENVLIANMDGDDNVDDIFKVERRFVGGRRGDTRAAVRLWRSRNGSDPWVEWKRYIFDYDRSSETIGTGWAFAARFGADSGGATIVLGPDRRGNFHSASLVRENVPDGWLSQFPY